LADYLRDIKISSSILSLKEPSHSLPRKYPYTISMLENQKNIRYIDPEAFSAIVSARFEVLH